MLYKFEFTDDKEMQAILNENKDKCLVEQQNITEGKFLIFSDVPIEKEVITIYTNVPKDEFEMIKTENKVLLQAIATQEQAIAELSATIATLKG